MSGRLSRALTDLRQRRHHRPFRIAEPVWDDAQRDRLRRILEELRSAPESAQSPAEPEFDTAAVISAATDLWRAQNMVSRDERSSVNIRQLGRYLRNSRKALHEAGVVIKDHDGLAFDSGYSLEALTFHEDPSLQRPTVLETVRPSIYLFGEPIQMGAVIVGIPPSATERTERIRANEHETGDENA